MISAFMRSTLSVRPSRLVPVATTRPPTILRLASCGVWLTFLASVVSIGSRPDQSTTGVTLPSAAVENEISGARLLPAIFQLSSPRAITTSAAIRSAAAFAFSAEAVATAGGNGTTGTGTVIDAGASSAASCWSSAATRAAPGRRSDPLDGAVSVAVVPERGRGPRSLSACRVARIGLRRAPRRRRDRPGADRPEPRARACDFASVGTMSGRCLRARRFRVQAGPSPGELTVGIAVRAGGRLGRAGPYDVHGTVGGVAVRGPVSERRRDVVAQLGPSWCRSPGSRRRRGGGVPGRLRRWARRSSGAHARVAGAGPRPRQPRYLRVWTRICHAAVGSAGGDWDAGGPSDVTPLRSGWISTRSGVHVLGGLADRYSEGS